MNEEEGEVITLDKSPKWKRTSENAESYLCADGVLTLTVIQDNGVIYLALADESVRAARVQSDAAAKQEAIEWATERILQSNSILAKKGTM